MDHQHRDGAGMDPQGGRCGEMPLVSSAAGDPLLGSAVGDPSPVAGPDQGRDPAEERERQLCRLIGEAGFAGTLSAMAGLARRWAEHPEVDARTGAELRLLGRRLDAIVLDVGASTRLS